MSKLRWPHITTLVVCGGLVVIAASTIPFGSNAAPPAPSPARDWMRIVGVVRDFRPAMPGFDAALGSSTGHVAGLVQSELNERGKPVFSGGGHVVASEWTDSQGRSIMPPGSPSTGQPIEDFGIVNGDVILSEGFAARVQVLGAAIQTSEYHMPVTVRYRIGGEWFEPFGAYENAVTGNVNDDQSATGDRNPGSNPRSFVFPDIFDADSAITVVGRSWTRTTGRRGVVSWSTSREASTGTGSAQVAVLRDGDPVPNLDAAYEQASIADYLSDYVDANGHVTIEPNQVIYLFELGTDAGNRSADFQDLVVLVSLATDPSFFETPGEAAPGTPANPCLTIDDHAGALGAPSDAGVGDADVFARWFSSVPGTNVSAGHAINLIRDDDGYYSYTTSDFTPIDARLFGNAGEDHNRRFTFSFVGQFEYDQCAGQSFEFEGADDAWLFVDGKLAMDLGGIGAGNPQIVEMDRLGLTDGQIVTMHFFYAHRASSTAPFSIRTNMRIITPSNLARSPGTLLHD